MKDLSALSIIRFHDSRLGDPGWPPASHELSLSGPQAWRQMASNHYYNTLLWNEEDKARRTDVGADEIAHCKRLIDRYNQRRNDAVEALDEAILEEMARYPRNERARLNSETAGAMVDRLSILSLKIHHMRQQTLRDDADAAHIQQCSQKLERLQEQRTDLAACFDALIDDVARGTAYFKVYRQFKMYNDPALNPYLYGRPEPGAMAAGAGQ